MTARVALAVMAKVPVAGAVKTRLCPPLRPGEAATLARCFLQDRVDQLAALPLGDPMVAFTPRGRVVALRSLVPPGVRLVPPAGPALAARLDPPLTALLPDGYAGANA